MHELSIAQSVVDAVVERTEGRRVTAVRLQVGTLSGVVADSMRFCFDLISSGTPLEGAALDIDEIRGRALCRGCGSQFVVSDLILLCPCGSAEVTVESGRELNIKSVEVMP